MACNLLMSVSKDERERAILRSRRMFQSDLESNIATAEARGKAKGEARAEARGEAIGKAKGIAIIARRLKEENMPIVEIARISGLSLSEVEKL